jgi:hypothetical protein
MASDKKSFTFKEAKREEQKKEDEAAGKSNIPSQDISAQVSLSLSLFFSLRAGTCEHFK